ncbi:MAG: hypothetical protein IT487_02075 [Chromatiaceae bacterium]|nr:hypothetical protein [Chromatiaceae bacterium]
MTRAHGNAAPGEQPGHGAREEASSQGDFPPSQAGTQRLKLLRYLERHGHISTIEARSILRIMSVAARIWELKNRAGHRIVTLRDRRKVAHYHLMPGQDVGGTDG